MYYKIIVSRIIGLHKDVFGLKLKTGSNVQAVAGSWQVSIESLRAFFIGISGMDRL